MRTTRWPRLAGVSGVVSAVFLLPGLLLLDLDDVQSGASRAEVVSTFSDNATEWKKEIGATLVGSGVFFLLIFLGRLRATVGVAEGEPGILASAAFAGGLVFATLLGVSAALGTAVASSEGFFENYEVDADTPLVLISLSNWIRGFATVGGGVLVGAASVVALKTRVFPRWLGIAGLPVAAISFLGENTAVFGFPILLILLWLAAVSVSWLRRAVDPVVEVQTT